MVPGLPCLHQPRPRAPVRHSRLFLAPETVDGKGDRHEHQEHSHGDEALHPGLQVPQAWREQSRMLWQAQPQWGLQVRNGAGRGLTPQGLEPVAEAISQLPGPEETFWGRRSGREDPPDSPTELRGG